MSDSATTWRDLILGQLDFYWEAHLRPRLQGLSDEEYLWEPVEGSWSLRPGDDGAVRIESVVPEPPVPPITTIAWRTAHLGRDVLGKRARALFGGSVAPEDADMFDDRHWPEALPLTAAGGLALLGEGYALWRAGIASLDDDALLRPLGPKGGPFAADSIAALAIHLNRETMAHGAEICLLRDLYRAQVAPRHPVIRSALAGHTGEVARLLESPTSIEVLAEQEPSLLADVAALHHWDTVRVLLSRGFPVTSGTETGATALHYAAAAGELDLATDLVRHGADAGAVEQAFGFTPAGWADHFGHAEVGAYLRGLSG